MGYSSVPCRSEVCVCYFSLLLKSWGRQLVVCQLCRAGHGRYVHGLRKS